MTKEQLENGKYIYEEFKNHPELKLTQVIKSLNIESSVGRRDFWSYIILDKCGVKDRLGDKEHLLNGYKGYLIANYSKFFKGIDIFGDFTEELKEFIFNFFMSTYTLNDFELRDRVDKEIEKMISYYMLAKSSTQEVMQNQDVIEEQKTLTDDNEYKDIIKKNNQYKETIESMKIDYHSLCEINESLNQRIDFHKEENNFLKDRNKDLEKIIKEDGSICLIKIDFKTKMALLSLLLINIVINLIK